MALDSEQMALRFTQRRRMAWVSMCTIVAFTIGMGYRLFIEGDDLNAWTAMATMTVGVLAGIVLGYTGAASYEQVKQAELESGK